MALLPSRGALGCVAARPAYIPQSRVQSTLVARRGWCENRAGEISGAISMETPKPTSAPPRALRRSQKKAPRTLCVDIGGTGIKAVLLDERGRPLTDRARVPT